LIQTNAVFLERRKHRRCLQQLAAKLFFQSAQLDFSERWNRPRVRHFARGILRVGIDTEHNRAAVSLRSAEKDIGDLGPFVHADKQ
jgi:hypothetical protein